jgi:hypothetical protein
MAKKKGDQILNHEIKYVYNTKNFHKGLPNSIRYRYNQYTYQVSAKSVRPIPCKWDDKKCTVHAIRKPFSYPFLPVSLKKRFFPIIFGCFLPNQKKMCVFFHPRIDTQTPLFWKKTLFFGEKNFFVCIFPVFCIFGGEAGHCRLLYRWLTL